MIYDLKELYDALGKILEHHSNTEVSVEFGEHAKYEVDKLGCSDSLIYPETSFGIEDIECRDNITKLKLEIYV